MSNTITYIIRHNVPAEASTVQSQFSQRSQSGALASPLMRRYSAPHFSQPIPESAPTLPQTSGAMSIGSIIEPNMRNDYHSYSVSNPHHSYQTPIGTAPRSLPPDLFYCLSPSGDSPMYSSSDSCYSPISDYLQPQVPAQPFFAPDLIPRPHSTTIIDRCYQPIVHSPLPVVAETPVWNQFEPSSYGFPPEAPSLPQVRRTGSSTQLRFRMTNSTSKPRQFQYNSPVWTTGADGIQTYEMNMPPQQAWSWTKLNY